MIDKNGHQSGSIIKQLVDLPDDLNDCWNWIGRVSKDTGYGKKQFDRKTMLAHRWVYSIFYGPVPTGLVIDHLCRNRSCVNPQHLEAVTQTENCRRGKGVKLTLADVREIRFLINQGDMPYRDIAKKYGVSAPTITDIKNEKSWKSAA